MKPGFIFVHGDIGSHNFIMNFDKCQMALIDFDLARKNANAYAFHNDICSMGETIAFLFPEVDKKSKRDMNLIEYAIYLLTSAMITTMPSEMCINKNALIFCKEVFAIVTQENTDLFNKDAILDLAEEIILQTTLSDDEVLRGKIG